MFTRPGWRTPPEPSLESGRSLNPRRYSLCICSRRVGVLILALAAGAAMLVCLPGCPGQGTGRATDVHVGDAPSGDLPAVVVPRPAAGDGNPRIGPSGVLQPGEPGHLPPPPIVPLFDEEHGRLQLTGLRGEVLGFHIDFPPRQVAGLRLRMGDLMQGQPVALGPQPPTISHTAVTIYRILPVRVNDLPGWYQLYGDPTRDTDANRAFGDFHDALLPIDHPRYGQPWTLPAGEQLRLWLDVAVPRDAKPGVYTGRLLIESEQGPQEWIDVSMTVMPLTMPDSPGLSLLAPIDLKRMLASELGGGELTDSQLFDDPHIAPLARKRLAQWVDLGRSNGVHFLVSDVNPIFKRDLAGKVVVDWTGYDRLVGPSLEGDGAPPHAIAPFRLDYPAANLYGGIESDAYANVADQYLRAVGTHFADRKWPQPLVWIHRDRPPQSTLPYGAGDWRDWLTPQRKTEALTVGRITRLTELDIGYLEPLPWAMEPPSRPRRPGEGPVPVHATVYCPPAQFLDPTVIPDLTAHQGEAWLGDGVPPWRPSTELFTPPEQLEVLGYMARRYGLGTAWLGPTQHWPDASPWQKPLSADDAGFLFYPGQWFDQDLPIQSLRLKRLRQAEQDCAYLTLLADHGRAALADIIARAMVKYALAQAASTTPGLGGAVGWMRTPTAFANARTILRQELMLAARHEPLEPEKAREARIVWAQFRQETAWIQMGLLPGQLAEEYDQFGGLTNHVKAVFRLATYSDMPRLVSPSGAGEAVADLPPPKVLFDTLPKTWAATRFNVPVTERPPGPGEPLVLMAQGSDMDIDGNGRIQMPTKVVAEGNRDLAELPTNVPLLPAHRFARPPKIDGLLNDWPVTSSFRGGAFHRLTPAQPLGQVYGTPRKPADTWFMAGDDDENLYLLIVCLGQTPDDIRVRWSNHVRLDDGLIVGEDAVEVLLDPTCGRLGRDDLLRLAVKANGTTIGYRGLTGPGGAGAPRRWGQDVRTEINFNRRGDWVIEMAVPRKSLAEVGAVSEHMWRLNVVRHVGIRGEHSAWASASPQVYEPESLGNLLLRPPKLPEVEIKVMPPAFDLTAPANP
ncbi:MAG: hypothetical protein BIFFINMI_00560 [Phycisphaerae bacterium]|nr:hypothetical protein [Phycisphaerae bacterium]